MQCPYQKNLRCRAYQSFAKAWLTCETKSDKSKIGAVKGVAVRGLSEIGIRTYLPVEFIWYTNSSKAFA